MWITGPGSAHDVPSGNTVCQNRWQGGWWRGGSGWMVVGGLGWSGKGTKAGSGSGNPRYGNVRQRVAALRGVWCARDEGSAERTQSQKGGYGQKNGRVTLGKGQSYTLSTQNGGWDVRTRTGERHRTRTGKANDRTVARLALMASGALWLCLGSSCGFSSIPDPASTFCYTNSVFVLQPATAAFAHSVCSLYACG